MSDPTVTSTAAALPKQPVGWQALAARWITSVAITYAFLIIVMAASVQQGVTAELEKRTTPISYSSALGKVKDYEKDKKSLDKLRDEAATLKQNTQAKAREVAKLRGLADNAWEQFSGIGRRAQQIPACSAAAAPLSVAPAGTSVTDDLQGRIDGWRQVIDCWQADAPLPNAFKRQIKDIFDDPGNFSHVYAELQTAKTELASLQSELDQKTEDVKAKDQAVADAGTLTSVFDDMNILRKSWLVVGPTIVEFPPAMLQILLAFVSGLFGALLVTLVLVVYPNTEFAGVSVGKEYLSRLLLGGLISVGTYVILGGGSAVLGNTTPFGENQSNFMTFCAVGVLAGMFSDRVAAWLSQRADTFFKNESKKAEASSGTEGGEAPPA